MSQPSNSQVEENHNSAIPEFHEDYSNTQDLSQNSDSSSTPTIATPSQESVPPPGSLMEPPSPQSRGRPRHKRRQPSRRYFTPPSRLPSPARPDFVLEVESAPQEPDIFADPETDYFSSSDKHEGPIAFRRRFFDAVPSRGEQMGFGSVVGVGNHQHQHQHHQHHHQASQSIDARLAGK